MADTVRSGLLNLDRKAMEEERLARVRKRTADQMELTGSARPAKAARADSNISSEFSCNPAKKAAVVSASYDDVSKKESLILPPILQYPRATLKRTWASGHMRHNDITIEEVLQASDLTTAMISSWQFDFDWLVSKINPGKTKFIFALEAKNTADKERWQAQFAGLEKSIRLCFPPMNGSIYARMHSKLMLLFHPTHLRIVIPSANPRQHDWGNGGIMENLVFLIDLPRFPTEHNYQQPTSGITRFQSELLHFLKAMDMPGDISNSVSKFDFKETQNLAFIHSIPGTYEGDKAMTTGILSVAEAVRALNCAPQPEDSAELDIASASVGSLDKVQINQFSLLLRGAYPLEGGGKRLGATVSGLAQPPAEPSVTKFRLVYPSLDSVKSSTGGTMSAGTIFLKLTTFENHKFPRDILHDYRSTRPGLLSHNKLILFRSSSTAYLLTGSANLSQSAFGRLSFPKTAKKSQKSHDEAGKIKMSIANWECGVLIPVVQHKPATSDGNDAKAAESKVIGKGGQVLPYSVFDKVLQIPFSCPPRPYAKDQKPWMQ